MLLNISTLGMAVVFIAFLIFRLSSPEPWTPWQAAGLAIVAPAFVLFATARITLGRAFSVRARATTLVTSGVYSRIRNPIYVFGGLMIAGAIIFIARPWFLLIFVLLIPLQIRRARHEAQVLEEKFGDAYRAYRRGTWF